MTKEDNSSQDALRNALGGYKPLIGVVYTMPDAEAPGAAEPAIAYQNDAPTPAAAWQQAKDSANATTNAAVLKLVEPGNDDSAADRKGTKLSKNDIDVVCMIVAAQCSNAGLTPDQITHITDQIRSAAQHANSAGDLLTFGNAAAAQAISDRQGDTVQHSMYNKDFDQQMAIVAKLDKEIGQALDPYMTEEEKKKKAEIERELANPHLTNEQRLEAETRFNTFHRQVAQREAQSTNPQESAAGAGQMANIQRQQEILTQSRAQLAAIKHPTIADASRNPNAPLVHVAEAHNNSQTPATRNTPQQASVNVTFGGFGDNTQSKEPTVAVIDEARKAVAPAVVASFSGFEGPDSSKSQNVPNAKPSETPTRQA